MRYILPLKKLPKWITPSNVTSIEEQLVLPSHKRVVRSHAFSSDGQLLALGSSDDNTIFVEIYDLLQKKLTGTIPTGWSGAEALAFHPTSGSLPITSGNAPSFTLWDPMTRQQLQLVSLPIGHQPGGVAVTSSGATIVTGGFDGKVLLWDWNNGSPSVRRSFQGFQLNAGEPGSFISSIAFSNDRQWLAAGATTGEFKLWRITFDDQTELEPGSNPKTDNVPALAFDTNSTRVAAACWDGRLRIVELATGRQIAALREPPNVSNEQMFSCSFSPSQPLLASSQSSAVLPGALLQFWAAGDGSRLHQLPVLCDRLGFAPDGTQLLVVRNSPGESDIPTLWGVPTIKLGGDFRVKPQSCNIFSSDRCGYTQIGTSMFECRYVIVLDKDGI